MSLFPNKPLLKTRALSTRLPQNVIDMVNREEYDYASEVLILLNIPFTEAISMIYNCTELLLSYLYKRASFVGATPATQQIVCHLYLEQAIFHLSSLQNKTDADNERKKIAKFIRDYKTCLDSKIIYQLLDKAGEITLVEEACLAFSDWVGLLNCLCDHTPDINKLFSHVLNFSVEGQRFAFMQSVKNRVQNAVEKMDESDKPSMDAVFDFLVETGLKPWKSNMQKLLYQIFLQFREIDAFQSPYECAIYFLHMCLIGQKPEIDEFLNSPSANIIDKDYIASFLIQRGLFDLAADVYLHDPRRHRIAIKFAMKTSMEKALDFLTDKKKGIRGTPEAHDLWILVLKLCSNSETAPPDCNWEELIQKAYESKSVTFDEIFVYVPSNVPIDKLQKTIVRSALANHQVLSASEKRRKAIEARADEQREIVTKNQLAPLEIDPLDEKATCFICGQPACDSAFDAFPCGHVIHMSCFLANMHSYFDIDTRIKLLSLANIAGKEGQDNLHQLANYLTTSCPVCGTSSLVILDKPFVLEGMEKEDEAKWDVPE